jgi:DNA-binding NtrC family response regulator
MVKLGNVLVLEDEPFISLDMEEMLKEFGAVSVTSLDTRADALAWLAANTPDLAVVDPRLNDGLCTDVVSALADAGVPFVVYSGADVDEAAQEAFARGEWLAKPTSPEIFGETLDRLLARSSTYMAGHTPE